jgi:hypothetical protein
MMLIWLTGSPLTVSRWRWQRVSHAKSDQEFVDAISAWNAE